MHRSVQSAIQTPPESLPTSHSIASRSRPLSTERESSLIFYVTKSWWLKTVKCHTYSRSTWFWASLIISIATLRRLLYLVLSIPCFPKTKRTLSRIPCYHGMITSMSYIYFFFSFTFRLCRTLLSGFLSIHTTGGNSRRTKSIVPTQSSLPSY
jgi:hypothetical protein